MGTSAWVFKEGFVHIDLLGHQHGCLRRVLHIKIFGNISMGIEGGFCARSYRSLGTSA